MSLQQPEKPVSLPMTLAKAKVIPPRQRATEAKEKVKEREKGKPNTHGTMTRKKCAASQGGTMTMMTMMTLVVERGQANEQKTLPIGTLPIGPKSLQQEWWRKRLLQTLLLASVSMLYGSFVRSLVST